jgi:hypothetical protein
MMDLMTLWIGQSKYELDAGNFSFDESFARPDAMLEIQDVTLEGPLSACMAASLDGSPYEGVAARILC